MIIATFVSFWVNLWILTSFLVHVDNAAHHWIHIAVVGTLMIATANQHVPCLPKLSKKYQDGDPSLISVINTIANWREILNYSGSGQESTYIFPFFIFHISSLIMKWCFCHFFTCTADPCKSSSGQFRLSVGIWNKIPRLQLTAGFPRRAQNVGVLMM